MSKLAASLNSEVEILGRSKLLVSMNSEGVVKGRSKLLGTLNPEVSRQQLGLLSGLDPEVEIG